MKTMTHSEIKAIMVKHHDTSERTIDRHMTAVRDKQYPLGDNDTVFFKMDGYPPRGYGIFIQQQKKLVLYTNRGRPYDEIEIEDVVDDPPLAPEAS